MSEEVQNEEQNVQVSDKELNFRKQEEMYKRKLSEMEDRMSAMQQEMQKPQAEEDDDNDDDPYVDTKRLNKKLSSFEKRLEQKIEQKAEAMASKLLTKKEQEEWINHHSDFADTLKHADKFAEKNPELAKHILRMPQGFDRQKLVYENIKALGLDKPEPKEPSIQEKIEANRKSPYYQSSMTGTAPYQTHADYSKEGQKQNYEKLLELKRGLRLQ